MDCMWQGIALVGLGFVLIGGLLVYVSRSLGRTTVWPVCVCDDCIRCGCNESWRHHNNPNQITRLP